MNQQIPKTTIRIWRKDGAVYANNGKGENEVVYREPRMNPDERATCNAVNKRLDEMRIEDSDAARGDMAHFLLGMIVGASFALVPVILIYWLWFA